MSYNVTLSCCAQTPRSRRCSTGSRGRCAGEGRVSRVTTCHVSCVTRTVRRTVRGEYRRGKPHCAWTSCREGCTHEVYNCWQIEVSTVQCSTVQYSTVLYSTVSSDRRGQKYPGSDRGWGDTRHGYRGGRGTLETGSALHTLQSTLFI